MEKKKIMVVEDERITSQYLAELLTDLVNSAQTRVIQENLLRDNRDEIR